MKEIAHSNKPPGIYHLKKIYILALFWFLALVFYFSLTALMQLFSGEKKSQKATVHYTWPARDRGQTQLVTSW